MHITCCGNCPFAEFAMDGWVRCENGELMPYDEEPCDATLDFYRDGDAEDNVGGMD